MSKFTGWSEYFLGKGLETPKEKKKNTQKEGKLQAQCVAWAKSEYPTLLLVSSVNGAVLQGTKEQRARRWKTLESEGATPGASDLFLYFPAGGYHGLCIEMKFGKNKQQRNQVIFQNKVEGFGYKYVVCSSLDEFKHEFKTYVDGRTDNKLGNGQIFDSER